MNALMAVRQAWAHGSVPAGRRLARRWGSRLLAWAFGVALAGLLALLWWGSAWLEVWSGHEALAPQPSTPTALISSVTVPSASVGQTAAPLPLGPEVTFIDLHAANQFVFQGGLVAVDRAPEQPVPAVDRITV